MEYANASSEGKEETGCGLCVVWDTETGAQLVYWYVDDESTVEKDDCACDCE